MSEPTPSIQKRVTGPAVMVRMALLLSLTSLYLSLTAIPAITRSLFSLALAIAAVTLVLRTRALLKGENVKARTTVPLVVGIIGITVSALGASATLVFRTELANYEECYAGANTHFASDACMAQLRDSLNARLGHLRLLNQRG